MYHVLRFGDRQVDPGQPVAGRETLSNWYWRELASSDVGAIVEQLHYRTLVNKMMAGNERVAVSVILDQFYKNPELPAPAKEKVVARAIQGDRRQWCQRAHPGHPGKQDQGDHPPDRGPGRGGVE